MGILHQLFNMQADLLERVHALELKNGFVGPELLIQDINDPKDQLRIRRYAWQITEEIGEALIERYDLPISFEAKTVLEEISDALHFYIELFLILGITPDQIEESPQGTVIRGVLENPNPHPYPHRGLEPFHLQHQKWLQSIVELIRAINLLKNRPWRTDRRLTDRVDFNNLLIRAFSSFIWAVQASGHTGGEIFRAYEKKNSTNHQRMGEQESRNG